ncbi:hypothetical protein SYNPS1DRAFT_23420, partial [Syncephalis pseudoplumigaleata]
MGKAASSTASSAKEEDAMVHACPTIELSENDAASILCSLVQVPASTTITTTHAHHADPLDSPEALVNMAHEKALAESIQVQLDPVVAAWAAGKRATVLAPFDPVMSPYGPAQNVSEPELAEEEDDDENDEDDDNEDKPAKKSPSMASSPSNRSDSDQQGGGSGGSGGHGRSTTYRGSTASSANSTTKPDTTPVKGSHKRQASEAGLEESQTKRAAASSSSSGSKSHHIAINMNDSEAEEASSMTVDTNGGRHGADAGSRAHTPSAESDENNSNNGSGSTALSEVSKHWMMKSTINGDGPHEPTPRRFYTSRTVNNNSNGNSSNEKTGQSTPAVMSPANGKRSNGSNGSSSSNGAARIEDGGIGHSGIDWSALELPEMITKQAYQILRDVLSTKDLQRVRPTTRRREALLMAITLILCRQSNIPRTFAELSKASHVPKRDIGACYKWLCSTLNPDMVIVRHIEPDEFMKRWCNTLQIEPFILPAAVFCYRATDRLGIFSGKCPTSVAAASIWFVIWSINHAATILEEFERGSDFGKMRCSSSSIVFNQLHIRDHKTRILCDQKTVASVAGVVIATLMSTYKGMVPYVRKLSPPGFLEAIVADDVRVVPDDVTGFGRLYVLGQLVEMLPS